MIPIRDTARSGNFPVVNYSIIALNILLFFVQMSMGTEENRFIYTYGMVPARWSVPEIARHFSLNEQIFAMVSFMFLHGGIWHLIGNMWSLYIFGDNIEDCLGHFRYLVFYLLCGVMSGVSQLILNFYSNIPTIGASGAIAGVMGAYIILHPRAKILTFIPIIIIPWVVEIPAVFFLGAWFVIQFINAAESAGSTGVAWWAHVGGFISGILFLRIFLALSPGNTGKPPRKITAERKSDNIQVIHPSGPDNNDPHLYGILNISQSEAIAGTKKLVNIPWGFYKRMVRVSVPPHINNGCKLRLDGLGKQMPEGLRGDLFLKVVIKYAEK